MRNIKTLKIICIIISILILLLIIFYACNKYPKYNEQEMINISKYLKTNSFYFDDIYSDNLEVDDKILNKIITSYLITSVEPNYEYNYNNCKDCYKYLSSTANILFYDSKDVDNVNKSLGDNLKKNTQEEYLDFNVLYYNKDNDIYYTIITEPSDKPKYIFDFKEYKQEKNKVYFDYYYAPITFLNDEYISIGNLNNIKYSDFFSNDNVCTKCSLNTEYFTIIRYEFNYSKTNKKYYLDKINIIGAVMK